MTMRRKGRLRLWWLMALVTSSAVLAVGCGGPAQDPKIQEAETVLNDLIGQDPQFERFALDLAGRSTSATSERLIVEHLASDDYQLMYAAAEAAARRPTEEMQQPLASIFGSKGGAVKIQAAVALAKLGDADATAWLRENVRDASGALNPPVVLFFAERGEDDVIRPALEAGLGAEEQSTRDELYALLAQIPRPWSVDLILKGLAKEHGEGRRAAIVALGKTGDASKASSIARFANTKGLVFATLEALGNLGDDKSISTVERSLAHREDLVKVYAAAALWKLGKAQEAEAVIGKLFQTEDGTVKRNLTEQLAGIDERRATEMLATLAADSDTRVRLEAVRALRDRAGPELGPILLDASKDSEYEVAVLAVEALGHIAGAGAIDALQPILQSENPYVAISAANAILEIHHRVGSALAEGE